MMNQRITLFVFTFLLSFFCAHFDAKALALSTLPSTLSDTCVEINLKSGTRIVAKIIRKTTEKVYFKKCDALADTTEYFVLQEKIDKIKSLNVKEDIAQEYDSAVPYNAKPTPKLKEEDKKKQTRIWVLLGASLFSVLLGFAAFVIPFAGILAALLFMVSSVWGLIEVLSYKGQFEGKGLAMALFITFNVLTLIYLLLLIVLIISLA
jgi:hypothetical protein